MLEHRICGSLHFSFNLLNYSPFLMSETTPILGLSEKQPQAQEALTHVDVQRVSDRIRSSAGLRAFLVVFLAGSGATASVGCLQDFERFRPGTGAEGGSAGSAVGGAGGKMENVGGSVSSTGGIENVGGGGSTGSSTGGAGGMENVGGGGSTSSSTGGAGGSMNVGGAGGADCMDIPVTIVDTNGEYEVKQYDSGCVASGLDTLGNSVFETMANEVCLKNNGSLIVQTHDAGDMNALEFDSPVPPTKVEFFQLGVSTPLSDSEADAYCSLNGTTLNVVTADQDVTATGFKYVPTNVGASNLWKLTF
jgi:hypothetical protein